MSEAHHTCSACRSTIGAHDAMHVASHGIYCGACSGADLLSRVRCDDEHAPRHPTSVAPGEAAGDGLDEPLGEGLGERLEWIVECAQDRAGGPTPSAEAMAFREWTLSGERCLTTVEHLAYCGHAIRELAGQRHALRWERDRALRVIEDANDVSRNALRERDAALAEVESLKESTRKLARSSRERAAERDAAIERAERAEAERDAAHADALRRQVDEDADLVKALRAAEARVRELEAENVALEAEVVGWRSHAEESGCGLDDPTPEPFDAWHARECPWSVAVDCDLPPGPCSTNTYVPWGRGGQPWFDPFMRRFAGRTCREVYAAEVLGEGGER